MPNRKKRKHPAIKHSRLCHLRSKLTEHSRRPPVKIKRSSAGLGLFADENIKKGAFVIEYTGERITTGEADRRGGKYLFTIDKKHAIDGKGRENISRYINHSCRPNCEAEADEDAKKVRIFARRNIHKGEELHYDYGKEYWDDHIKPYGCRCEKCQEKGRQKKRRG